MTVDGDGNHIIVLEGGQQNVPALDNAIWSWITVWRPPVGSSVHGSACTESNFLFATLGGALFAACFFSKLDISSAGCRNAQLRFSPW